MHYLLLFEHRSPSFGSGPSPSPSDQSILLSYNTFKTRTVFLSPTCGIPPRVFGMPLYSCVTIASCVLLHHMPPLPSTDTIAALFFSKCRILLAWHISSTHTPSSPLRALDSPSLPPSTPPLELCSTLCSAYLEGRELYLLKQPADTCFPLLSATPLPSLGGVHVLMATYDHFGHGLMAIVQRVINQILLSSSLGFEPFVFIGERPFAEPQACEYGPSPYFDASLGSNVWDYWFLQPADYRMGMTSVRGQPVLSVQVASVAQADRTGPVRSYGSPASYNRQERHATRLAAHQIVGRGGVKLVQPAIRDEAASLFRVWRGRSGHVMGVHVRGTDKVVQPKVPPEAYFPFIEAYFSAHSDAILFVATDDDKYSARIWQRYQKVLSSGRLVRASNSSAHAAALGSVRAAYDKGRRVLLDALLLSQACYLTRAK